MKSFIALFAVLVGANAHADIGNCAATIKYFAEKFATDNPSLDITPDGSNTSLEPIPGSLDSKVTLVNSSGTRIRRVRVHMGPNCSIMGVVSMDADLN